MNGRVYFNVKKQLLATYDNREDTLPPAIFNIHDGLINEAHGEREFFNAEWDYHPA